MKRDHNIPLLDEEFKIIKKYGRMQLLHNGYTYVLNHIGHENVLFLTERNLQEIKKLFEEKEEER